MKTSLDHLPAGKQRELNRVVKTLLNEFDAAQERVGVASDRRGSILKVILYGSHARGDWVGHDTASGFRSDYDILVIVNRKQFTDFSVYWDAAEDRFLWHDDYKTPVELIVHSLWDVNSRIREGRYFFRDIREEGIMLYEAKGAGHRRLAEPGNLSPEKALEMATEYFEEHMDEAQTFLRRARDSYGEKKYKNGAFQLHQATENAYHAVMLTYTLYAPKIHNLTKLRKMTRKIVPALNDIWPDDTKFSRRCFNLLKDAYVKARYSLQYRMTQEEQKWLMERVAHLHHLTETACKERLAAMKTDAASSSVKRI